MVKYRVSIQSYAQEDGRLRIAFKPTNDVVAKNSHEAANIIAKITLENRGILHVVDCSEDTSRKFMALAEEGDTEKTLTDQFTVALVGMLMEVHGEELFEG